jgi:L-lactate dehydrogenase complex protein LldG
VGAREEILGRVRAALRTARLPARPASLPPIPSALEAAPPETWRARFVAELLALGVAVHEATTPEEVRELVRTRVAGRRVRSWARAALPYDLGATLAEASASLLDGAAERAALAAAEVGVTGVDAAIAETGTLALIAAPDRPRTASLLPQTHVAVVRSADLVPNLRSALTRLRGAIPAASALQLVTGPSRSADIELQLTLGVHGPGELVVVLGP